MANSFVTKFKTEVGLQAFLDSPRDAKIICFLRLCRLFAYGGTTLILALFLSELGIPDSQIGLFMTLTLVGDVLISLVLTVVADGLGRRRILGAGALLMIVSGVVFATSSSFWALLLASVVGVISPSGNEIGPFKAIEESTITQMVPTADRNSVLSWYNILAIAGTALGSVASGWVIEILHTKHDLSLMDSYRVVFWSYAIIGLLKFFITFLLSSKCEVEKISAGPRSVEEAQPFLDSDEDSFDKPQIIDGGNRGKIALLQSFVPALSPATRSFLLKFAFVTVLDASASGLVTPSWMTYYFNRKFDLPEGQLGTLFFVTNVSTGISILVASMMVRRMGLIRTMVSVHFVSTIFLTLIPFPSNVIIAIALLLCRQSTNWMDLAPRQAFIASAVLSTERTAVMGIINVIRILCQSIGPSVTGTLAGIGKFWIAFVIAGSLKFLYDFFLFAIFRGYRPLEEKVIESRTSSEDQELDRINHDGM